MYIPPAFRVEDQARLAAFLREYSFATFITNDGVAPFASHLPMLYRSDLGEHGTLIAHLARANPQWQHFAEGREALAIFHGPHGYISPSWYATSPAVPTWNYAVVHAYGVPRIFEDHDRIAALLRETISLYESSFAQPWPGELPADYLDKMIRGIVALSANDGVSLVAWKNQEVLGWQLYDVRGEPIGKPGSAPSRGSGAAAVVLGDGRFAVFP